MRRISHHIISRTPNSLYFQAVLHKIWTSQYKQFDLYSASMGKIFLLIFWRASRCCLAMVGGHIGSYAPTGAGRLMGMDEDYESFIQLLASEPKS